LSSGQRYAKLVCKRTVWLLRPSPGIANNYFDGFFHVLMRTNAKGPGDSVFPSATQHKTSERLVRLLRIAQYSPESRKTAVQILGSVVGRRENDSKKP